MPLIQRLREAWKDQEALERAEQEERLERHNEDYEEYMVSSHYRKNIGKKGKNQKITLIF